MKNSFSHIGLAKLCGWFGLTRQAYYQNSWSGIGISVEEELVLKEVLNIKKNHNAMGVRKIHYMLQSFLLEHQIKMGRDALFDLLAAHKLLVKRRKRRIQTTWSQHWLRKYPNLIRDFEPTAPNQLWVSDITYWKISNKNLYITFITDAYSHKIVGYHLADNMEALESRKALEMALHSLNKPLPNLIHHSDRGVQYCSSIYVNRLNEYEIKISMTENGDPLENAIAERVNGIIKEEYLNYHNIGSYKQAQEILKKTVILYNQERPHLSIDNLTPSFLHKSEQPLFPQKRWKNYYKKKPILVKQFQDNKPTVN
jgi:putative transposase